MQYRGDCVVKKDKMFLLIFIFSINSILICAVMKLLGFDVFNVTDNSFQYPIIGLLVKFIILLVIYYLIIGSITRFAPRQLFFKMLPFFPLTIILYYLPYEVYSSISALILLVTCVALIPKFSTFIRFAWNVLFVAIIQMFIMWLRFGIAQFAPVFPNELQFAIINIDQLVILSFLYFINRKWGGKYGLDFHRKNA